MRTTCSPEIFTKKCRQQPIFDSDLKGAWHYNHVTFTPIAQNFMLYCRLIYMLSILCVRLTIKVKVGIPESFKVGWYPPKKKLGRVTLKKALFESKNTYVLQYYNEFNLLPVVNDRDLRSCLCYFLANSNCPYVCGIYLEKISNTEEGFRARMEVTAVQVSCTKELSENLNTKK